MNEELRKFTIESLVNSANKNAGSLDKLVKEANETASSAKKESEAAKTGYKRILKTILLKS